MEGSGCGSEWVLREQSVISSGWLNNLAQKVCVGYRTAARTLITVTDVWQPELREKTDTTDDIVNLFTGFTLKGTEQHGTCWGGIRNGQDHLMTPVTVCRERLMLRSQFCSLGPYFYGGHQGEYPLSSCTEYSVGSTKMSPGVWRKQHRKSRGLVSAEVWCLFVWPWHLNILHPPPNVLEVQRNCAQTLWPPGLDIWIFCALHQMSSRNCAQKMGVFDLPIRPSIQPLQFQNGPSVLQRRMAKTNLEWLELHKSCSFGAILKQFQIYGRTNRTLPLSLVFRGYFWIFCSLHQISWRSRETAHKLSGLCLDIGKFCSLRQISSRKLCA